MLGSVSCEIFYDMLSKLIEFKINLEKFYNICNYTKSNVCWIDIYLQNIVLKLFFVIYLAVFHIFIYSARVYLFSTKGRNAFPKTVYKWIRSIEYEMNEVTDHSSALQSVWMIMFSKQAFWYPYKFIESPETVTCDTGYNCLK